VLARGADAAMTIAHPGEAAKNPELDEREEADQRRSKNILDACPGTQTRM